MFVSAVHSSLEISSEWLVVESAAQPQELHLEASKFIDFDIDEVHTCVCVCAYACAHWKHSKPLSDIVTSTTASD